MEGSGDTRKTHRWQFAAIRLPAALPHIVLDARGNNRLGTNLPTAFGADQRVSLGQPLDRHFTSYAPAGYGFDAHYIFTPDLIAYLVDGSRHLDVEIVDNWLFLYSRQGLPVTSPRTWQQLSWLAATVGARVADRADTYRDHRLSAPVAGAPTDVAVAPTAVAPQGRRLRTVAKWTAIVGGILGLLYAVIAVAAKVMELF